MMLRFLLLALAAPLLDVDDKPACKAILASGSAEATGVGSDLMGGADVVTWLNGATTESFPPIPSKSSS